MCERSSIASASPAVPAEPASPAPAVPAEPASPAPAVPADPEQIPLERLEREITELAAHIYAATCRWLLLVAEFDRRDGWLEWGCKSCAHWLSWRCGVGLTAAREQVRVAKRLSELPTIRARFERGELSYSQVRALSRVATPETESGLVDIAQHATAAQLEVLVRAYRGVLARELDTARRAHEERYLVHSYEDDGSLVIHARLPAEEGAVVLAALEAGRDAVRARGGSGPVDVSAETSGATTASVVSESPPAHAAVVRCDDRPASEPTDVSAETPDERTLRPENRPEGASASNADALVLLAETLLSTDHPRSAGAERYQVVVHVDATALQGEESGACELEGGPALHPETARRIACDASLVRILERDGRPLSVGRKTRSVPPALRRALRSRDRTCRFPGCDEHRFVDAHHIHHWARGGLTKLSNLIQLCRRHHRLLHEGGYTLERSHEGGVIFRRPDGRVIPQSPRLRRGDRHELVHRNRLARLKIDPDTCIPDWYGDHLDKVLAVDCLVARDPRLTPVVPSRPASRVDTS